MNHKLVGYTLGSLTYGLFVGWSVTADLYQKKMLGNQRLLGDLIKRKETELQAHRELLLTKGLIAEDRIVEVTEPIEAETHDEVIDQLPRPEVEASARTNYAAISSGDQPRPDVPEGETPDETRARLAETIRSYVGEGSDDADRFDERERIMEDASEEQPYVISRSEYAYGTDVEDANEYDKQTLTYFPRERILVDDDQELVDDPNMVVGWSNLNRFGDESEDADTVFIRNRRFRTDYEVVRDEENSIPAWVRMGMDKLTYDTHKAAGTLRNRDADD